MSAATPATTSTFLSKQGFKFCQFWLSSLKTTTVLFSEPKLIVNGTGTMEFAEYHNQNTVMIWMQSRTCGSMVKDSFSSWLWSWVLGGNCYQCMESYFHHFLAESVSVDAFKSSTVSPIQGIPHKTFLKFILIVEFWLIALFWKYVILSECLDFCPHTVHSVQHLISRFSKMTAKAPYFNLEKNKLFSLSMLWACSKMHNKTKFCW